MYNENRYQGDIMGWSRLLEPVFTLRTSDEATVCKVHDNGLTATALRSML